MQIVLSAKNGAEVLVMPVVPTGIRIPSVLYNSDSFSTPKGDLTLFGSPKLREIGWESKLPKGNRRYSNPRSVNDPFFYTNVIQSWLDAKIPIRVIVTSISGKSLLNMACTVQAFDFEVLKNGDVTYAINLKEYIFATVKKV